MPPEKARLRIGNLAKAVLVSGQAYQDPKDALNEFVSNAADEYAEAGRFRVSRTFRIAFAAAILLAAVLVSDRVVGRLARRGHRMMSSRFAPA